MRSLCALVSSVSFCCHFRTSARHIATTEPDGRIKTSFASLAHIKVKAFSRSRSLNATASKKNQRRPFRPSFANRIVDSDPWEYDVRNNTVFLCFLAFLIICLVTSIFALRPCSSAIFASSKIGKLSSLSTSHRSVFFISALVSLPKSATAIDREFQTYFLPTIYQETSFCRNLYFF